MHIYATAVQSKMLSVHSTSKYFLYLLNTQYSSAPLHIAVQVLLSRIFDGSIIVLTRVDMYSTLKSELRARAGFGHDVT